MKTFNNIAGTTSSEFSLGAGTGNESRHFVLSSLGSNAKATDRLGADSILVSGVEFYDLKLVAINGSNIVAKHLRGVIYNSVVSRVEDVYQEDFEADVTLTVNSELLSIECSGDAQFTVDIKMTRTQT
jgi:hypothetical protein